MDNPDLLYLRYIIKHKWEVFKAGVKLHAPLHRLIIHDWTKFTPMEWVAYRNYFYGDHQTIEEHAIVKDKFNRAWNHHQKANKHHWQYWVMEMDDGETVALKMPIKYVREMAADWIGAGRALGKDNVVGYYLARNVLLAPESRKLFERLIGCTQE